MNNPMFFRPTRVLVVENWPDDRGVSVITEDGGEVEWMTDRDDDVPSGYEDLFEELKRKMAKPPGNSWINTPARSLWWPPT